MFMLDTISETHPRRLSKTLRTSVAYNLSRRSRPRLHEPPRSRQKPICYPRAYPTLLQDWGADSNHQRGPGGQLDVVCMIAELYFTSVLRQNTVYHSNLFRAPLTLPPRRKVTSAESSSFLRLLHSMSRPSRASRSSAGSTPCQNGRLNAPSTAPRGL
ncbi:hypothetical protein BD414DRAFT_322607 [Trametes punicea]|nr:hypothetical protein BD414DRAFT_322607 [Trametes punicea]